MSNPTTWTYSPDGSRAVLAGSAGASSFDAGGVFNAVPKNLLKWRGALARMRNGGAVASVMVLGDSTSMGTGAGSAGFGLQQGAFAKAWPQQLPALSPPGAPFVSGALLGTQGSSVAYGLYDPRVTLGAGWAPAPTTVSLGFAVFQYTAGAVAALTFTPPAAFDTFSVYYLTISAGMGTFSPSIDAGAALATLNGLGATGLQVATYSVAAGIHAIKLTGNNNGKTFIAGITTSNSTAPAVQILNASQFGAKVAQFLTANFPWAVFNAIPVYAPDLSIICLTINDSNTETPLYLYEQQLVQLIQQAQISGSVVLVAGAPGNTTQALNGTLAQYLAVNYKLALQFGLPFISIPERWVSYAAASPVFPYFDATHPEALGYQDIAQAVMAVIGTP